MASSAAGSDTSSLAYPAPRRADTTRSQAGRTVEEPYGYFEDPEAEEVKRWVTTQNELSSSVFEGTATKELLPVLKDLMDFPKYGTFSRQRTGHYYFWHNTGVQNQSVLYRTPEGGGDLLKEGAGSELERGAVVVLDPNTLSEDGTAAVTVLSFSESGKYLAYGVSRSGSDWSTLYVADALTGERVSQGVEIEWVKFSGVSWLPDDSGFFFCRYDPPAKFAGEEGDADYARGTETDKATHQKICFYALDTPASEVKVVYEEENEAEWMFGPSVSEDGKHLFISVSDSCAPANQLWHVSLEGWTPGSRLEPRKLVGDFRAEFSYVTNDGDTVLLRSNEAAKRGKLIQVSVAPGAEWAPVTVLEEDFQGTDAVLETVMAVDHNKYLVVEYTLHACSKLLLLDFSTATEIKLMREIPLPSVGNVSGLWGDSQCSDIFFSFTSFLYPGVVSRHALDGDGSSSEVVRTIRVEGVNADDFVTEQVFVDSTDGARIPMFVVHHKEVKRDGTNPTLLYGYGGFSIPMSPHFAVSRVIWMQRFRGVYALGCWRGGAEYGEKWHEAAIRDKKQATFDDVKATGQWLCENKFTSAKHLAIMGGSNGGAVMTATANQSPELFACVVAQVPVTDMLQFHKWTIGYAWTSDWGCADKEDEFDFLRKWSPLHTVPSAETLQAKKASYPALLVTTADHDDRVVPQHSYKFMATIQHALGAHQNDAGRPLILRVDVDAGHGGGKPLSKQLEEAADTWGFIARYTGASFRDA